MGGIHALVYSREVCDFMLWQIIDILHSTFLIASEHRQPTISKCDKLLRLRENDINSLTQCMSCCGSTHSILWVAYEDLERGIVQKLSTLGAALWWLKGPCSITRHTTHSTS